MKTIFLESVDSTNEYIKTVKSRGSWSAVIAETQTAGKGTKGRKFVSPKGGVYMSLSFPVEKEKLPLLTHLAAAAAWRSVFVVLGKECEIKWVNDLIYNGKKVCGISTEVYTCGEEIRAVVGIGFNAFRPQGGYGEYGKVAGCIVDEEYDKAVARRLANAMIKYFKLFYDKKPYGIFMESYVKHLAMKYEHVRIKKPSRVYSGILMGVTPDGRLILKKDDGEISKIHNGELIYDYK